MERRTIHALRVVIVLLFAWLLLAQTVVLPQWATTTAELFPEAAHLRVPVLILCNLGLVTVQVALVCVWRLLTMVRRGTVFTAAALRDVDVLIGSATGGTLLALGVAVTIPQSLMPPWVALGLLGALGGGSGVALVLLVLRRLLAQAVALDVSAAALRAELSDVI